MPTSGTLISLLSLPPEVYTILYCLFLLEILVYLAFLWLNSLTRLRYLSPDSMNYIDVARNIVKGRGVTQSTLGFNEPYIVVDRAIPSPMTSHPPLYPVLIALFSRCSLSCADAALTIPVLCYGGTFLLSYLLTRELYDERTALAAVTCLLFFQPLRKVSLIAWSETLGIVFLLICFWLLARNDSIGGAENWIPLAVGLAIGFACSTSYAFLPGFFLGILLFIKQSDGYGTLCYVALYIAGFCLPTGPTLGRNLLHSRTLMGLPRHKSITALRYNIRDVCRETFGNYLVGIPSTLQVVLFMASVGISGLILARHHELLLALENIFVAQKRHLLILWSVIYLVFIVYVRTRIHFDTIGLRQTVPAGVPLVLLWAALFVSTTGLTASALILPALLIGGLVIYNEINTMRKVPPYNLEQKLARSERLTWIARRTTNHDLIIGDDAVDIPFYFEGRHALSFSPYPYTAHLEYSTIIAYITQHRDRYNRFYLVLRNRYRREEIWQHSFGPFIADIVYGRLQKYPYILYLCRLRDGYVFEFRIRKRKNLSQH